MTKKTEMADVSNNETRVAKAGIPYSFEVAIHGVIDVFFRCGNCDAIETKEKEKGSKEKKSDSIEPDVLRKRKMTGTQKQYKHGIPKGYIGVETLRELLGKSVTTIWKMTHDGRLPKPLRDGKRNVWEKLEVERWIKNGKFLRKR